MATYMIDYENVKTGGLNGISRLTSEDRVIIFYSENANRITFDLHKRLMECQAAIEYREVTVGGHNALDFQLVTYLGYLIAQNKCGQYLIISNDRGFEYVVNFWRKDGLSIGLLPYLKDPAYALQKVARAGAQEFVADDEPCEQEQEQTESVTEESHAEPAPQAEPAEVIEEIPEDETNEPAIEVEFYSIEEEPQAEIESDITPEPTPAPAIEQEPAPAEPKKSRRSPRKKAQPKKAEENEPKPAPAEQKKTADKPARLIPTIDELRTLVGAMVEDDLELRFVSTAIAKYKTKLGLNNALVKNFGNQKAGEIYQKVKQFAK